MEEKSTKNRKVLSQPLRPDNVPTQKETQNTRSDVRNVELFRDILDINPSQGFFFYIKMPSIIFLATVSGYIVGKFNLGIMYLLLIGYTIYFVYNRKVERFTRSLKALIYHNTIKEKTRCKVETDEWLNHIVKKFWEVAEPSVSAEIYQQVNTELNKITPPFPCKLNLTEFTLGSRPPIIYGISYMDTNSSEIVLEAEVVFVPLETSKDAVMYYEGSKAEWNTKIQLTARIGTSGAIGVSLPIMVKELSFSGKVRIGLNLIQKNTFVKDVEICLLKPPSFDFTLVPLKTVDVMDVPGLGRWIRRIINQALSSTLINPKSIKLDVDMMAMAQGKTMGIVCLQLLNLENEMDERLCVEIDIDGKPLFQTRYQEGREIVYNEYFYMIVTNSDEKITLCLHSDSKTSRRRVGSIFLQNLPLTAISENRLKDVSILGNTKSIKEKNTRINESTSKEESHEKDECETDQCLEERNHVAMERERILGKSYEVENVQHTRKTFFSKTRLVREDQTYGYINNNLQFYPITKEKRNSAIVKMHLISAEDIRGNGMPINHLYSSFCTIIVSPINKKSSSLPLSFIENTVSATALLVSGVLNTAGNVITNIVPGMGTTSTKLLPSSSSTFYVFESKKIFTSSSPVYNDQFTFFSRDVSVDVVSVCVMDEKSNEVIGKVGIPVKDIVDGKKEKYRLKDAQSGRLEVFLTLNILTLKTRLGHF